MQLDNPWVFCLLGLSSHYAIILFYGADKVYPSRVFRKYALLGDDIVIADPRVADVYQSVINALGVNLSLPQSLISDIGGCEFAKRFRICDRDLSPVSVKMLRAARHAVAWMPVCKSVGVSSLQVSLRLRGAGYRRYSSRPENFSPYYSRHWFSHVLVAFSPSGIRPMPFEFWLGYPYVIKSPPPMTTELFFLVPTLARAKA